MSAATSFIAEAADLYARVNAANLEWALDRPRLARGFLNTKQSSITLRDYGPEDGMRGPGYLYGWMAGRGLEALVTHADFFAGKAPALAAQADAAAHATYESLRALKGEMGHTYFCYDPDFQPVFSSDHLEAMPQTRPADIYTYSDAFAAKGLVAAAASFAPEALDDQLAYLQHVIAAVEDGRFQMNERIALSDEALARQPADFGPYMILLGAAELLVRVGRPDAAAAYAHRFIDHVLSHHHDPESGLLRTVVAGDGCNAGHGLEFVGFALAWLPRDADAALVATLESILVASFRAAFIEPGIALDISMATREPISTYCPWWSLPETMRSAALVFERTGSEQALAVWQDAHTAFFGNYWREQARIACQTLTPEGPVDYVPATPDLDPGYHTGLSLLTAIRVAERLGCATPFIHSAG